MLPGDLPSQLKKLSYLSTTTIEMLSFGKANLENSNPDALLLKMKQASMSQEERYESLYGQEVTMDLENPEEAPMEQYSSSQEPNEGERE